MVMASNRLRLLGHANKSKKGDSLSLTDFPRKGKKASMVIGRRDATPVWMTTTTTEGEENRFIPESRLADWWVRGR